MICFVLLIIVCLVMPPYCAYRKGYNPVAWVLAGGLIGLIILGFLPYTNKPEIPAEEQTRRKSTGNFLGVILSSVALAIGLWRTFG